MTNADLRGLTPAEREAWERLLSAVYIMSDRYDGTGSGDEDWSAIAAHSLATIRAALFRLPADAGAVAKDFDDMLAMLKRGKQGQLNLVELRLVPASHFADCEQYAREYGDLIERVERNRRLAAPPSPPVEKTSEADEFDAKYEATNQRWTPPADDARDAARHPEFCGEILRTGDMMVPFDAPSDDDLAADAQRYRWLRARLDPANVEELNFEVDVVREDIHCIVDAAIDAAINASMGDEKT